jgi:hypothetical protein
MAAVAGSKGRISPTSAPRTGHQVPLLPGLLDGRIAPSTAALSLLGRAKVREVGIDTNMICNLACRYCYLSDRAEAQGEVALPELLARLSFLASTGAKLFAFIGKEPLADGRAVALLGDLDRRRKATGRAFRTGMVTNGTLIGRWLDDLVEADLSYLDISLDGLTDWENRLRGRAVSQRIRGGVDAVVRSALRPRLATATVLSEASLQSYPLFVEAMLDEGVPTCFASPVLRFAMSNEVSDIAVGLEATMRLYDRLAQVAAARGGDCQVILDLPYRYTWALLRSGRVRVSEVREDEYEALYWDEGGSGAYLKLNPFPYSYWRALRITHDGRVILNMDLAAHSRYAATALDLEDVNESLLGAMRRAGPIFLEDFIGRHAVPTATELHERDLAGQSARAERIAAM